MHMDGWGAGAWALMALGMVLFWGLVILGVVWLARALRTGPAGPMTATDVLERRLAEGDLSVEEYRQRRAALSDQSTDPASSTPH